MGLMQPGSVSLGSVSLQGMEPEQKAGSMIELLARHGKYRNREKHKLPYEPGYPLGTDEISALVKEFFRNVGGFLTESYCVLRYGACKGLEELFYFVLVYGVWQGRMEIKEMPEDRLYCP